MHKTRLKYHLILVTKYRKPILSPDVMQFVIDVIEEKLKSMNIDVIAIRGDDMNHLHIMMECKPTQSISMIVRYIKQCSSFYSWKKFGPTLRSTYWYKNLFWSGGYFCSSTGDASSETVKKYIESQGN